MWRAAVLFGVVLLGACGQAEPGEEDDMSKLDGLIGTSVNFTAAEANREKLLVSCNVVPKDEPRDVVLALRCDSSQQPIYTLSWGADGAAFSETILFPYAGARQLNVPVRGDWFKVTVQGVQSGVAAAFASFGKCPQAVITTAFGGQSIAAGGSMSATRTGQPATTVGIMPQSTGRVRVLSGGVPFTLADSAGANLVDVAAGEEMDWVDVHYAPGITITNNGAAQAFFTIQYELDT